MLNKRNFLKANYRVHYFMSYWVIYYFMQNQLMEGDARISAEDPKSVLILYAVNYNYKKMNL